MGSLKFLVILGSVRENRIGERVVKCFMNVAKKRTNISVELVDAKEADLPVVSTPLHFMSDPSKGPQVLIDLNEKMKAADGYIIVSAEYNRLPCPGINNLLNHLPPSSFEYKASGILTYSMGGQGGCFAAAAIRPFLSEMGCLPVKHMTIIPTAHKEIDADGTTTNEHIESSMDKLLTQVEWFASACKVKRDTDGVPQ